MCTAGGGKAQNWKETKDARDKIKQTLSCRLIVLCKLYIVCVVECTGRSLESTGIGINLAFVKKED